MKFDVLTLFPEMFESLNESILGRAIEKDLININMINIRDFSKDKHKKVDDTPYGGGDGMVLMCQPVFDCYRNIEKLDNSEFIMLSPQGETFNQKISQQLAKKEQIILLCGHYEGFDERIRIGLKPREISIGDFILTGGELASLVLIDSISRHIENFLGKTGSFQNDSFSEILDGMLEYPHYTKPRVFEDMKVPEVLLNGNHKEIEEYRKSESLKRTKLRRPDLLK
jgi:tRNA (guanine37-N1)-methyltransferase